jgi:hypothetical protein
MRRAASDTLATITVRNAAASPREGRRWIRDYSFNTARFAAKIRFSPTSAKSLS